jgi:hypothetical protein
MVLSSGTANSDGNELAAITLLVLQREHPCQREHDDEDYPTEEDDIAEIESVLLDSAVDIVIALAKVLKDQFAPEFNPFYQRLVKSTVASSSECLTLQKSKNVTERSMAIAGLGEITGALKGGVAKHTGELLEIFMQAIDDPTTEVSSNAIYAVGLLCEGTPQDLSR